MPANDEMSGNDVDDEGGNRGDGVGDGHGRVGTRGGRPGAALGRAKSIFPSGRKIPSPRKAAGGAAPKFTSAGRFDIEWTSSEFQCWFQPSPSESSEPGGVPILAMTQTPRSTAGMRFVGRGGLLTSVVDAYLPFRTCFPPSL